MQRGAVYLHKNFQFKDSFYGAKYIILLNSPKANEPAIFVKTTTRQKDKPSTPGCIEDRSVFFIPAGTTFFPEDTWVQLYETYEIIAIDNNAAAKLVAELGAGLVDSLVKCLLYCDTEDISPIHRRILSAGRSNPIIPSEESLKKLKDRFRKK